jgi:SAM-dependent methyltransferase
MRDTFQQQGSAAQVYEEQKVPAMFAPLARATLDEFRVTPQDVILDVACGTGILARTIKERVGPSVRISGADLNAGMIETARRMTEGLATPIRWEVADALETPFADGEFTVVMCQQGVQFFPDDQAAVKEMRRVLRKDGRLAITVWAGVSPYFRAMADAIERHVGREAAQLSLSPFSYDGADRLPRLLGSAGFDDVNVGIISVDRVIGDPVTGIPKEIMGNTVGVGPTVAAKGEAVMTAIIDDVVRACAAFMRGTDLVVPQEAHIVTARAA